MITWEVEEVSGAKLGDGRLKVQLIKLAARFADKPASRRFGFPRIRNFIEGSSIGG